MSKILKWAGILAGVVIVGIALGWLATRRTSVEIAPVQPATDAAAANPPDTNDMPVRNAKPRVKPTEVTSTNAGAEVVANPIKTNAGQTNLIADWEDKVDGILTSDAPEADKAKQMLEMFPHLSEEAQVEVAQHLANLVADENYAPLAKYLTDSSLPESVLDVLLADVLNRPNSVKLPALLDVAKDDKNPKASEAKDLLELFLEEDYGKDWAQWQTKMEQWLKDNPD